MNLIQKLIRKKPEKWYNRENIPAIENALNTAIDRYYDLDFHFRNPLTPMSEHFLGCGYYDFYVLGATFPKEVDIFLARIFEKIIKKNYTPCNEEIMKYLKGKIGQTGFTKTFSDYINKMIGFNYKCFSSDQGELTDYIGSGNFFIKNSRGDKIVISIMNNQIPDNQNRGGVLNINLTANSSVEGAREACCEFIDLVNRELGTEIQGSQYAMGARGYPVRVGFQSWDDIKIPEELKKNVKIPYYRFYFSYRQI